MQKLISVCMLVLVIAAFMPGCGGGASSEGEGMVTKQKATEEAAAEITADNAEAKAEVLSKEIEADK